jgi:hypothetical protein
METPFKNTSLAASKIAGRRNRIFRLEEIGIASDLRRARPSHLPIYRPLLHRLFSTEIQEDCDNLFIPEWAHAAKA